MNDTMLTDATTRPACAPEIVAQVDSELRDLDGLSTHQLSQRYRELFHRDPPIKDARWKRRRIAWQVQAMAYGGLSERAVARLREIQQLMNLSLEATGPTTRTTISKPSRHDHLQPGTVLERQWHDETIRVLVRDDGFEFNGRIFKSLSAVATNVTGQHWSGNLFFNLRSRSRK